MRKFKGMACVQNVIVLIALTSYLVIQSEAVNVGLCYAYEPNVTALAEFDWAVVDSDAKFEPPTSSNGTIWLSYVSVGEVQPHRKYFNDMPRDWFMGNNSEWASYIINQTSSGWPSFFVDRITAPLWQRGFKGFFLDTLDSYQRAVTTDAERQAQQSGLVRTITALKTRFPNAILIFNRGFEIMSRVHQTANMVAFESLYSGWNQAQQKYVPVNQNDRDWLLANVQQIKSQYNLPILSIDYCPPKNLTCARSTINLIMKHGIVPYVTDPMLQTVGYGPQNIN